MVHFHGNDDQIIPEQTGASLRPRQEKSPKLYF